MSKTLTVTLAEPVEWNGQTYRDLTFRKAKTGDLVAADSFKGDMAQTIAILASMADVPIQVMKELDLDDFGKISEQVLPLMGTLPKLKAGSTLSQS